MVVWWTSEHTRLSDAAAEAIADADDLAMAAISWYELARLAAVGTVDVGMPVASWLRSLSEKFRTIGITPAIAGTAAALPAPFPGDPCDRLIYATAVELGCQLVTKDRRMRDHPADQPITVW